MCYSVGAPTGEAFIEPNQERASPKGPALFLFVRHSRKHPTAEGSPAIPIYPAPPKSALTLSRPLRCRKLSAGKCTHPLPPALLSARAAPGRGPYPNHSTALTPGTEAPGPAGPRAGLARRQSDAAQLGPLYDGGAKLGRLLKRGRARRVAPAGLYPPWGASARPLGWRPGGPAGPGAPAGAGSTINGSSPLLPCWGPHCSTASRVCARRSRPATHPAGAIYASPRFFSCCRAPPSRAFNSVWARPLTVPCFLGTAQQGRKGYNTCISQVTQQ